MTEKQKIRSALVVLSPDLVRPDKPSSSALLRRAVDLAKITGCRLELFHVTYDGSLDDGYFGSNEDRAREREALMARDATRVSEVAARLRKDGVDVQHEVRWGAPRTDAILRKIAEAKPDVVMKQSREHSYFLGLTTNTDWDLARRSPANLWLVSDEVDRIDRIVAAVGSQLKRHENITSATDYDLFRSANAIADAFGAAIYPVNAFQVPRTDGTIGGAGGAAMPAEAAVEMQQTREVVIKRHSDMVDAFAQYFGVPRDNVHLSEGRPSDVIPQVTEALGADLLVMGASSITRLERFIGAVTVEPVMADTRCDIVIVRDPDPAAVPEVAGEPEVGKPKFNLEKAISHPQETFSSPKQLAATSEISLDLRDRILQAWEHDIRAEMNEENEGGPISQIDVNALKDIAAAKAQLQMNRKEPGADRATLGERRA